jgi:uncharacterized protein YaaW (UPF0174 family)
MTGPEAAHGSSAVYPGSAPTAGAGDVSQRGVAELVREVTQDLTKLLTQELALAKAEVTIEAKKAGKSAGEFGAAGLAGYFAVLFASVTLMFALAAWWDSHTFAALFVTVLWAIAGAVLFSRARTQARQIHKPEKTIQTLKEGVR